MHTDEQPTNEQLTDEQPADDSAPVARLRDAVRRLAALTATRAPTGLGHDDAPDDEGTVATDDAIGFDPLPLLEAFDRAGAPVVAMGQVAGILHGSTELTGDLDLLWHGDPDAAAALAAAFHAERVTVTDDDGRLLHAPAYDQDGDVDDHATVAALAAQLAALPKVQFRSPRASGDCCTPDLPWGDLDVAAYVDRAETATTAGGRTVRYLALDDLVQMRRAVDRPKDRRRAAELEALRAAAGRRPGAPPRDVTT